MCYSAQVWADYRKYVRMFGADVSVKEFFELYWLRANGEKVSVLGGMDAAFKNTPGSDEQRLWQLVEQHHAKLRAGLQAELSKQEERLETAELALSRKARRNKRTLVGCDFLAVR